jgi:hypothetical protein
MNLILDGQYPVEILMEHHLQSKMNHYPLIVIPECIDLETSFVAELKSYITQGGHLLLIGTESAKIFQKELGIKTLEKMEEASAFIAANQKIGSFRSALVSVGLMPEAKVTSNFYNGSDFVDKSTKIASSVNQMGKGFIAAVYFNAGSSYLEYKSPVLRDFIGNRIAELFSYPMVNVSGSRLVHIAVNQLNSKMYVNLINVAGEHTNQAAIGYDEIPSIKDLSVSIKTLKKPSKIVLQPEGRELKFDHQNGTSKLKISNLAIHSILEIVP